MVKRTWVAVVAAVVASLSLGVTSANAHPLHTTLTEVSVDVARHSVRAVVRVFSDDIGAALAHRAGTRTTTPTRDADAVAYVLSTMSAVNRATPIALHSCGVKRNGDLLWVCIEGDLAGDGKGLALKDSVLCELFSDQVNIVQVSGVGGSAPRSVLFTRGDGAKTLL